MQGKWKEMTAQGKGKTRKGQERKGKDRTRNG